MDQRRWEGFCVSRSKIDQRILQLEAKLGSNLHGFDFYPLRSLGDDFHGIGLSSTKSLPSIVIKKYRGIVSTILRGLVNGAVHLGIITP